MLNIIKFSDELDKMNELFLKKQKRIKLPAQPPWLRPEDGLAKVYEELELLKERGTVYYSCLVQANTILFSPPPDYPKDASVATVMFNHNLPKTAESDPLILSSIANYLFECRKKPIADVPEWLRPAVNVLNAEIDRSRVLLKADIEDNFSMNATMQSVIVFREHLPKYMLRGKIIPIIAAPKSCESIMVFPCSLWSAGFRRYWDKA